MAPRHRPPHSLSCWQGGIQALEAMLYTLDRINADLALLPGIKLGAHILDDCDKDTHGLEMAVDFIKGLVGALVHHDGVAGAGRRVTMATLPLALCVLAVLSSVVVGQHHARRHHRRHHHHHHVASDDGFPAALAQVPGPLRWAASDDEDPNAIVQVPVEEAHRHRHHHGEDLGDGTNDVPLLPAFPAAADREVNRTYITVNGSVVAGGTGVVGQVHWPIKKEAVVEGDLVLGGLMMVHEREDTVVCGPIMPQGGVQALEAMLYTLDVINRDPDLLPGINLGAHILDDCDKDTYGLEMAVDFIKGESPTREAPPSRRHTFLSGFGSSVGSVSPF
ncbi:hypothetical protein FOCC_FOCC010798, partial [Frankliniella occidentalis]